ISGELPFHQKSINRSVRVSLNAPYVPTPPAPSVKYCPITPFPVFNAMAGGPSPSVVMLVASAKAPTRAASLFFKVISSPTILAGFRQFLEVPEASGPTALNTPADGSTVGQQYRLPRMSRFVIIAIPLPQPGAQPPEKSALGCLNHPLP